MSIKTVWNYKDYDAKEVPNLKCKNNSQINKKIKLY